MGRCRESVRGGLVRLWRTPGLEGLSAGRDPGECLARGFGGGEVPSELRARAHVELAAGAGEGGRGVGTCGAGGDVFRLRLLRRRLVWRCPVPPASAPTARVPGAGAVLGRWLPAPPQPPRPTVGGRARRPPPAPPRAPR